METSSCFSNVRLSGRKTGSKRAETSVAPSNFVVIGLLFVSFLINGCSSGPSVHNNKISAPDEITAPANVTKANVGIYYEPNFANYIHIQTFGDSIQTRNIGLESVLLFNTAIPKVFENTQVVDKLPPYDILRSGMDGIVEPRLNYVSWKMLFHNDVEFFRIEYTFMFYTSDGVPISNWTIVGTGPDLEEQLADAAQQFVSGFDDAPETKTFREYLKNKRVGKLSFDANEIEVTAKIDEDNELGLPLKVGGILPVQVSVKNMTDGEITGRGFDVRLIDSCGKRLAPAFPLAVVSRFEYMAALNATDPALVGMIFGPFLYLDLYEQDKKRVGEKKHQARYFEKSRLKEVTLEKGEPIEGTLYFILPYDVTELNEATLSFWFIDPSVANGVTKEVSLSGIDYRRSPQLEQQRSSLAEDGVLLKTSSESMGSTCSSLDSQEAKSPSSLKGSVAIIEFYGQAEEEVNTNTYDKNLWAKALVDAQGDEQKRKARYIELRATQLYIENGGSISAASLNQQAAPKSTESNIDNTGTFVSEITNNDRTDFMRVRRHNNIVLILEQHGDTITGTDSSGKADVRGTRKGDTIKFDFWAPNLNYGKEGVWKVNANGTQLEGSWRTSQGKSGSGQWNLKKIE